MKNLFNVFFLLLVLATPSFGQGVRLLDKTVNEGDTAYFPVVFYDENNQAVVPEKVWFKVDSLNGTAMQAEKSITDGGSNTTYFTPGDDTYSSQVLTVMPCGNRIENESGVVPEQNVLSVWFLYPNTCTLTGTSVPCKQGSGVVKYSKNNIPNAYVRKGAATPSGGVADTYGMVTSSSTAGSACTGSE